MRYFLAFFALFSLSAASLLSGGHRRWKNSEDVIIRTDIEKHITVFKPSIPNKGYVIQNTKDQKKYTQNDLDLPYGNDMSEENNENDQNLDWEKDTEEETSYPSDSKYEYPWWKMKQREQKNNWIYPSVQTIRSDSSMHPMFWEEPAIPKSYNSQETQKMNEKPNNWKKMNGKISSENWITQQHSDIDDFSEMEAPRWKMNMNEMSSRILDNPWTSQNIPKNMNKNEAIEPIIFNKDNQIQWEDIPNAIWMKPQLQDIDDFSVLQPIPSWNIDNKDKKSPNEDIQNSWKISSENGMETQLKDIDDFSEIEQASKWTINTYPQGKNNIFEPENEETHVNSAEPQFPWWQMKKNLSFKNWMNSKPESLNGNPATHQFPWWKFHEMETQPKDIDNFSELQQIPSWNVENKDGKSPNDIQNLWKISSKNGMETQLKDIDDFSEIEQAPKWTINTYPQSKNNIFEPENEETHVNSAEPQFPWWQMKKNLSFKNWMNSKSESSNINPATYQFPWWKFHEKATIKNWGKPTNENSFQFSSIPRTDLKKQKTLMLPRSKEAKEMSSIGNPELSRFSYIKKAPRTPWWNLKKYPANVWWTMKNKKAPQFNSM